ncbi:MAG: transposase [Candidatus Nealsonbacteria bacterium]|nr:transposase [Candidatus Nealsonbacteria bacterium]
MPGKRKVQFVNGGIYHIVTRAVDGTELFREQGDNLRMTHDIFEFNDLTPLSSALRIVHCRNKNNTIPLTTERRERKLLVEILAFCFMPNHVHLLLRQLQDRGVQKFMQKLGGYTTYYNKKYQRQGYLFQGRYRAVHIKDDKQLMTVFVYIHTNPVALLYPGWKERGIKDIKKAIEFINQYRWSSYLDYLGIKNFPSLTSREFLIKTIGGMEECQRLVEDWLYQKRVLFDLDKVALE